MTLYSVPARILKELKYCDSGPRHHFPTPTAQIYICGTPTTTDHSGRAKPVVEQMADINFEYQEEEEAKEPKHKYGSPQAILARQLCAITVKYVVSTQGLIEAS